MMLKNLFLALLFLISPYLVNSQCQISASYSPLSPMCGSCVSLSAYGSGVGNIAFQEDFNSGSPTGWGFTQAANYSNPCSPGGVDGTPHMWMDDTSINPRDMTTVAMDLSLGGTICFDMLFATQGDASPCEGPDEPDEGVYLQYSTNGGATWTSINYFDPNGGYDNQLTNWNNYCFNLPAGALTANTMIQWHQDDVTDNVYDHWGIDNVTIILNDPNYEVSWLHDGYAYGVGNGGGVNPNQVCLTNDSTFTAQVTDGTNTCTASVTVTVALPDVQVSAGNDTSICAGDCINLNGLANVVVSPASTPTFENSEVELIIGGPQLPAVPCLDFSGCNCWDGSSVGFGSSCPDEPGELNASMNINVQNLNTTSVFSGFITDVCISSFYIDNGSCTGVTLANVEIALICPGGSEIILVPTGGLTGTNITNMCFQPSGISYSSASSPYSGTFQPANPFTDLNGCSVNGNWKLEIRGSIYEFCFPLGGVDGWSISFDDPEISYTPAISWAPTTNMTGSTTLNPNVCPTATSTYTLTASDTAGCVTVSDPITVSIAPTCCPLAIDLINTIDATCGLLNGEIEIIASGNTGVINYSIDNGVTFQTGNVFSNLPAGTYDIVVQDDNCSLTQQVILIDLPGPNILQVNTIDPSCGNSDGEIDIQASGGNGTLNYSIDNGATFQTGNTFSNLPAGSYNIIVEDAQGCQTTSLTSLNNSLAPVIDVANVTDPTCGNANGQIEIIVSGGTGTINYSIDNGATFQVGNIFTGLTDGIYDLVVTDANGCSSTSQVTLVPTQGIVFDAITIANPSCGVLNGTISIQVSSGATPYLYSIDNGVTTQAATFFGGLGSSSYTVWVQDNDGCIVDSIIVLNSAGGPNIDNVIVSDPSCTTPDGTIDIVASGGNGTLVYSVNNGVSFQAGSSFSGLPSGNYTVIVQDANMCEANMPISLNNFPGPTIDNIITTDPTCGNTDGQIEILASGTATIQYSINNGSSFNSSSTYSSLAVGTYEIVVVDGNGCQAAQQVILNNSSAPIITNLAVSHPMCGLNNGSIMIIATGTPTLMYSIDGGIPQIDSIFSNLGAGTKTITVIDGNGCQATTTQTLTFISGPTIDSVSVTSPNCNGDINGFATVFVSNGTPSYQFSLDGALFQGSNLYSNLGNGTYSVQVTDQNSCSSNLNFTVTEPSALSMVFTSVNATCFGSCDGSALAFPSGGTTSTGAYSYNWSGGIAGITEAQANNVCAGSYILTVSDDNGCTVDDSFTISEPNQLVIDVQTEDEICFQDCQGTIEITPSLATASYSIDGGLNYSANSSFNSLCPGTYSIIVMEGNNCTTLATATVIAAEELIASFVFDSVTITTFNSTVNFTNTSTGGINFDWDFEGVGVSNNEDPTFTFPEGQAGNYLVCLRILDVNTCTASECNTVIIEPEFFFYVPNTFTPDNDGVNDSFYANGLGIAGWDFEMLIYNRWGQLIFKTTDPLDQWNGTFQGVNSPDGAYIWRIKIEHPDFVEDQSYIGHVNLLR